MTRRELLQASVLGLPLLAPSLGEAALADPAVPRQVLAPDVYDGPCAAPYSGGMFRDERGRLRLYYLSNYRRLALAVSDDGGRSWSRPDLGAGRRNVVLAPPGAVDAISVARDAAGNYRALVTSPGLGPCRFYESDDGVAWREHPYEARWGDRSSLGWLPSLGWVVFARVPAAGTDADPRRFDLWAAESFPFFEPVAEDWLRAAPADGPGAQLYGVDLVAPDGRLALTIFSRDAEGARPKINRVCLARLRDLEVRRESYAPAAGPSDDPASWCWGNVQGVAGGLHGTKLFVSGRGRGNVAGLGYVER